MAKPDKKPAKDAAPAKKTCFVIGPIGAEGSETRRNADNLFLGLIKPAIDECGIPFDVLRADHMTNPGSITEQVINAVIDSDLVIADLSERNPNAYYELGIRHVVQKPTIHVIAVGQEIPFDNRDSRAIHFDPIDLAALVRARQSLVKHIESCMAADYTPSNAVTLALGAKQLKLSGDPKEQAIADLLQRVHVLETTTEHGRAHQRLFGGLPPPPRTAFSEIYTLLAGEHPKPNDDDANANKVTPANAALARALLGETGGKQEG